MFVSELQKQGAKEVCMDKELPNVNTDVDLFSMAGVDRKPFTVDRTVSDGETFTLAGVTFTAYSMPGHTSGSAVYAVDAEEEKWLFTGDVLFQESIGRTDFPTGSLSQMRESLRRLKSMDGEYKVFSGHGDDTTLETERQRNVFLQDV